MRLYFVSFLLAVSAIEEYSILGECDENSVPYKIEINPNGRPELYCTSSTFCFGSDNSNSSFYTACTGFQDDSCYHENEWLGGLMELNNGTNIKLTSKCCKYPGLEQATKLKTLSIGSNNGFTGGVFISNKGIEGFDLIKEVQRIGNQDSLLYEVVVVRLPCKVDVNEEYDLLKRMGYIQVKPLPRFALRGQLKLDSSLHTRRRFPQFQYDRRNNFLSDYYDDFYQDTYSREIYSMATRNQISGMDKVLSTYSAVPAVDDNVPMNQVQVDPVETMTTEQVIYYVTEPPLSPPTTMEEIAEIKEMPITTTTEPSTTTTKNILSTETTILSTSSTTLKPNTVTMKNAKLKIKKFMVPKRIQFKRGEQNKKVKPVPEQAATDLFVKMARI